MKKRVRATRVKSPSILAQIEVARGLPKVHAVQKFTEPPPRYNEASLVKELRRGTAAVDLRVLITTIRIAICHEGRRQRAEAAASSRRDAARW